MKKLSPKTPLFRCKDGVVCVDGSVTPDLPKPQACLGIDPDVHKCAFAYLTDDGYLAVRIVRQKEFKRREAAIALIQQQAFKEAVRFMQPDILVTEGQDVRYTGKTSFANPHRS